MRLSKETTYDYEAFISYTRHDTKDWKTSRWIHRQLSRFVVPSSYRRLDKNGKYVRQLRVFRDVSDLPSGELPDKLKEKLGESENLILISSLESGDADWVEREVSFFLGSHSRGNGTIMPLLVDGQLVPESFPPSFNQVQPEREYLIVSLEPIVHDDATSEERKLLLRDHNYGKKQCLYSILSALTGMERRDVERRLLRQRIWRVLSYLALPAALALLFLLYKTPRYEYYAEYNSSNGIPVGVMPLSREQVSHRNSSCRFEYRRIPIGEPNSLSWRLVRVMSVTSDGTIDIDDDAPVLEMEYARGNGTLSGTVSRNANGAVCGRSQISNDGDNLAVYEDFKNVNENQGISFLPGESSGMDGFGYKDKQQTSISRYAYKRDERGFVLYTSYHANNDFRLDRSAVCDEDGVWATSTIRDNLGNPVDEYFLSRDNTPMHSKDGVAHIHREYDEFGLLNSVSYFDITERPITRDRVHLTRIMRDVYGNVTEISFWGPDGSPCINDEWYHKCVSSYDERGRLLREEYFDTKGKLCQRKGFGAVTRYDMDRKARTFSVSYYTQDGKPYVRSYGYQSITRSFNKKWQEIRTLLYDENGVFLEDNISYASDYDQSGRQVRQWFIDGDGHPVVNAYFGFVVIEREYDQKNNLVEQRLRDEKGDCVVGWDGWAIIKMEYDERDNLTKGTFYDEKGSPIGALPYETPVIEKEYDDFGRCTEMRFRDSEGAPVLNADGYHRVVHQFDERGDIVEESFYDVEGNLTFAPNDYFSVKRAKYDKHRQLIEIAYYGLDGRPCYIRGDGEGSIFRYEYNSRGLVTKQTIHHSDGSYSKGYTISYDELGRINGIMSIDEQGRAMPHPRGVVFMSLDHNERGYLSCQREYADAARKCLLEEIAINYTEQGNIKSIVFRNPASGDDTIILTKQIESVVVGAFGEIVSVELTRM